MSGFRLAEIDAGVPVAEILRRHGISKATHHKWKASYGGHERLLLAGPVSPAARSEADFQSQLSAGTPT